MIYLPEHPMPEVVSGCLYVSVHRGFQLLAVVLDQVKPLGRRTTIEVAFHGVGPVRKDRYIQLPVDAEAAVPPMSITV